MKKEELLTLLHEYESSNEKEKEYKTQMINFINENDVFLGRVNENGHITASAWVVNSDMSKALMNHHRKADMWLHLGGHTEENENVLEATLREVREESGIENVNNISNKIFDLNICKIPDRITEKEHIHYDIVFLFQVDDNKNLVISDESKDLKWIYVSEIEQYSNDSGIIRMVDKTKILRNRS
ncbi:MAG TPA: NUDIX hydrolase [Clostridiales bacterium]|nr:MAG: hypothetical protein A2Y18_02785 [Clostridiales bacterium GWD2_32_19]HCC07636.1 NUDIX hydrolase [Clostridiales bacterium]